ncbi:hypothetical protein WME95_19820 [Sorangium sp. So ce327]|uniref:hypothetical protein n=1 Tax=Sorangium sp. So ce327 TaxID=3133301 RepID=UPI003F5EA94A
MSTNHSTRIKLRLKAEERGRAYLDALSHANSREEVEALRGQWLVAENDLLDDLRVGPQPETVQQKRDRYAKELTDRMKYGI